MKNTDLKKKQSFFTAAFCMLLVALVYYFFNKEDEVVIVPEVEKVDEPVATPTEVVPDEKLKIVRPKKDHVKNLTTPTAIYKASVGFNKERYDHFINQKILINKFKDLVKLQIDLPKNMTFINIDMDDNVAGIYGFSLDNKKQFAMLATPGKVKTEDVLKYLSDSKGALPMMEGRSFKPDEMKKVSAPESTGLQELTVIPTNDARGTSAFAALAERKDGQGTYLFMMEAPPKYFDQNEDGLELMLQSIKPQP